MIDSPVQIPYVNLGAQWKDDSEELLPIIDKIFGSGQYVGGEEIEHLEDQISKFCQDCLKMEKRRNYQQFTRGFLAQILFFGSFYV